MLFLNYEKHNNKNARRTAFLLFLCIAIVVNAAIIYNSLNASFEEHTDALYGRYTYCAFDVECKNTFPAEETVGIVKNYGLIGWEDTYWVMGTADETAMSFLPLELIEGRFPENGSEIVVEESVAFFMGWESLEKSAEIRFYSTDGHEMSQTFSVVGIVSNYTQTTPEGSANPFHRFPNVLSGPRSDPNQTVDIVLLSSDAPTFLQTDDANRHIFANSGKTGTDSKVFKAVNAGVFALLSGLSLVLMITSVLLENNVLKNRLFLWKSAGCDNSGYLKFRCFEVLIWGIPAVILGIFLGVSLASVVLLFLKKCIADWVHIQLSCYAWTVVPGVTFAIFGLISLAADLKRCSVSPMQLTKAKQKIISVSHIGAKSFSHHPSFVRSLRNVFSNSTDYVSLILCFAVLFTVSVSLQIGGTAVSRYFEDESEFDYTLYTEDGAFFSLFSIPDNNSSFSDSEMSSLEKCDELTDCFGISKNRVCILGETEEEKEFLSLFVGELKKEHGDTQAAINHAEDEYEMYGYDRADRLYSINLIGASREVMAALSNNKKAEFGVTVVVKNNMHHCYSVGDRIMFTAPRKNEEGKIERTDMQLPVAEIVYMNTDSPLYGLIGESDISFVVSQEMIESKLNNGLNFLYLKLKSPETYEETEKILEQIETIHSHNTIWSMESKREANAIKSNLRYLLISVSVLAASIMSVYVLSAVVLVLRQDLFGKREIWGYLRAASMSESQAYTNELFSILFCLFGGFIIFGIIALIFLGVAGAEDASVVLSLCSPFAILIPGVVCVAVCLLLTRTAIRKFWSVSVSQLIHAED